MFSDNWQNAAISVSCSWFTPSSTIQVVVSLVQLFCFVKYIGLFFPFHGNGYVIFPLYIFILFHPYFTAWQTLQVMGPRRKDYGSRWNRLLLDGNETKYEIWETKFLIHLRTVVLKDAILNKNLNGVETDTERNEEARGEFIQFLDDNRLSLSTREASDNGREALRILRDHYSSKWKPRIIPLNTEIISLKKEPNESMEDNIITKATLTTLRNTGESLSDSLIIVIVLKGLPDTFNSFTLYLTNNSPQNLKLNSEVLKIPKSTA